MSEAHKQHTLKRRELEMRLRDYGVSRSARVALASSLTPESLDRLLKQLKMRRILGLL